MRQRLHVLEELEIAVGSFHPRFTIERTAIRNWLKKHREASDKKRAEKIGSAWPTFNLKEGK